MLSRDRIDDPLGNVCRVIADTLKIFCHHQHIRRLLAVFDVLINLFDQLLLKVREQIIDHIILRNHRARQLQILVAECVHTLDDHISSLFRHAFHQIKLDRAALVCRVGHQNRHLGNIRRMVSDPLHIGIHL